MTGAADIQGQLGGGPARLFIRRKSWLVAADALEPRNLRRLAALPPMTRRKIIELKASQLLKRTGGEHLALRHDAIQFSLNHYRARGFTLGENRTEKIVFRHSRYGENTLRELAIRCGLLTRSPLKVPTLHDQEIGADYIRFTEQLLFGRPFSIRRDCHRFESEVGLPLMQTMELHGTVSKPLSDVLGEAVTASIMNSSIDHPVIAQGKALLQANPVIASSVAHGDLVSSNMVTTREGIYVVDWERSHEMFAGYDFTRLALRYPRNRVFGALAARALDRYQQGRLSLAQADILRHVQALIRDHGKTRKK